MPLTLGHLIDAVPNTSAADIAELADLRENHPKAVAVSLTDLAAAFEHPVEAVVHESVDTVEHVASKIAHWGGDLIASLEEHLKGHPNRNPEPAPVIDPAASEPVPSEPEAPQASQPGAT